MKGKRSDESPGRGKRGGKRLPFAWGKRKSSSGLGKKGNTRGGRQGERRDRHIFK